uniref:Protein kinase domain-containing protein n=1 Tax=Bionectria ochroleuca TaxID=29856 RepID=A0A8H7NA00_BIOOC
MELSEQSIHDVIHPTAAFSSHRLNGDDASSSVGLAEMNWQTSSLNPKNRIDSLDMPKHPLWEIDGCTAFGGQFYAVPLFLDPMRPLRVDVFIPEPSKLPLNIRELLDVDVTFHTRDKERISRLGLTRHVLRILQFWVTSMEDPRKIYKNLPFGSRIVLQNIPINISQANIIVAPSHALEMQLLSVPELEAFWGPDIRLPPCVDIGEVAYMSQLHDSVCLVSIGGRVWIFKALTSYPKYLYHELRQLLKISPHPNIVSQPAHLVTKKCSFGGKTAVLGFTLEYHPPGSLRDLIPFLQLHGNVGLQDKVKWAVELSSALVHLRENSKTFYPDLRLDNIVLSADGSVVMVDFEQRGVWCEFAAPEVNAIEYIRLLAIDQEIPESASAHYSQLLSKMLPRWEDMGQGEDYRWPSDGYNIPWSCLTQKEQESCEVYMLGRVLWCIFEAKSAPQRAAAWLSYRWEPIVEFPDYTGRTPGPLRDLIDRCTRGRRPGLSKHIVREGNQLVLRRLEGTGMSTPRRSKTRRRSGGPRRYRRRRIGCTRVYEAWSEGTGMRTTTTDPACGKSMPSSGGSPLR